MRRASEADEAARLEASSIAPSSAVMPLAATVSISAILWADLVSGRDGAPSEESIFHEWKNPQLEASILYDLEPQALHR